MRLIVTGEAYSAVILWWVYDPSCVEFHTDYAGMSNVFARSADCQRNHKNCRGLMLYNNQSQGEWYDSLGMQPGKVVDVTDQFVDAVRSHKGEECVCLTNCSA